MVDGVAPLDLNQTPPLDSPLATEAEMVDDVGVGVASSENQIPSPDPHSPSAIAKEMADGEMADGVASIDLNEIRPPDHPSSSSAAPHQPLSPEHWTREEHGIFLLGMELYGVGNWKEICENGRMTKTPAQLESHAQEYFYCQMERHARECFDCPLEREEKTVAKGTRRESM